MSLWFRMWYLLLVLRPWRRPMQGLETSVITMRVWPTDLDLNRHVTNGRYFGMADIGRLDFVLRSGAWKVAWRRKAMPIVGDAWAKFRRELKPFETFEIHTRMLGWNDKWSFMEHRFVRQGRVAAIIVVRGLFRARKANVPPSEFLRDLGLPETSPPLPHWLQEWADSCEQLSNVLREEEKPSLVGG